MPKSMLTRRALLAGASGLVATPAMAQFNPFGGRLGGVDVGNVLSGVGDLFQGLKIDEAGEIRMGDAYYENFIDRSGGRYRSSAAQQALKAFAEPVIQTTKRTAFKWEVVLLADNTVNAWAIPGGKLGINAGLVRYCAEPADLAAVIAHEVGHAELSHARAQMRSDHFNKGLTNLGKEAIRSQVGAGGVLTDRLVDTLAGPMFAMISSGYSQEREFESDGHVLTVFSQTSFPPARASNFYRTMLALVPKDAQGSTSLYPSHPGMLERIAKLEQAAPKYPAPTTPAAAQGWSDLKRIFPTRRPPQAG